MYRAHTVKAENTTSLLLSIHHEQGQHSWRVRKPPEEIIVATTESHRIGMQTPEVSESVRKHNCCIILDAYLLFG